METSRGRVYKAFDWFLIRSKKKEIEEIVANSFGCTEKKQYEFNMQFPSGWLTYQLKKEVQSSEVKIIRAKEAEEIAKTYYIQLINNLAKIELESGCVLLPDSIKNLDTNYISSQKQWLVRFKIQLPIDTSSYADFIGSRIEMRIALFGQIVYFNSQWTPLTEGFINSPLLPYIDSHTSKTENQRVKLVYSTDGDGIFQSHFWPFYYNIDGHHQVLTPATQFSLDVQFLVESKNDKIRILCIPKGGSGEYLFNWFINSGIIKLNRTDFNPFEDRILLNNKEITYSQITLKKGFYTVGCRVLDTQTTVLRQFAQQIFYSENKDIKLST